MVSAWAEASSGNWVSTVQLLIRRGALDVALNFYDTIRDLSRIPSDKNITPYLEIGRDLEQRRVRCGGNLDDVVKGEVKHVSAWDTCSA
jgi:hypothetical protein